VRAVSANARIDDQRYAPAPVAAQVTFYEGENFFGRSFTTDKQIGSFRRPGFNDRASSVVVLGDRWKSVRTPNSRADASSCVRQVSVARVDGTERPSVLGAGRALERARR